MSVAIYSVTLPIVTSGIGAFKFSTSIGSNSWGFQFIFMNNRWTCYATPPPNANPDLSLVREASVYNYNLNWEGYPDYGCFFYCPVPEPGINDINNVGMYILDWAT